MARGGISRAILFWVVVALAIIVPFLLFGEAIERATLGLLDRWGTQGATVALGALVLAALAADLVLPVPSSLVMIAAGTTLERWPAIALSTAGLSIGHLAGFWVGRLSRGDGLPQPNRGAVPTMLALAATRPVPVLAEALTLAAGRRGLSPWRFLAATVPANGAFAALCVGFGKAAAGHAAVVGLAIFAAATGALIVMTLRQKRSRVENGNPL